VSKPPIIDELLRQGAPVALGVLMRRFGDLAGCEDAVQEALIAAGAQWPARGTPENPEGWLIHVASRRMIDWTRSEDARRRREGLAAMREPPPDLGPNAPGPPDLGPNDPGPPDLGPHDDHDDRDDTLALIFMCCHPALTPASAIALTLRAVGGLTTAEIAAALLVPEPTMAQRISRAKQSIKASAVRFAMPTSRELPDRRRSVLHILYLIFNEGYLTTSGSELLREELSAEAIRLTRMAHSSLPDDPEVTGLLALMLLTEARRPARATAEGELISLAEQDRALWDPTLIAEGGALISGAWALGSVGEYQLQAAIAAVHDQASDFKDTDWAEILGLYCMLERITGNPMVALNRAVAAAMVDGPAAGLALLGSLEPKLSGHHRLQAVRAHLLEMGGEVEAAIGEYTAAADAATNLPERHYLIKQAARLSESSAGGVRVERRG
jgi:RNA polymerase sigma factor (sigma-70 family)